LDSNRDNIDVVFMKVGVCALAMMALVGVSVSVSAQQKRDAAPVDVSKNAREITTDHLQIATYATADVVSPGAEFSLVFEIIPRRGVHVYAPGDHKYKIVRVTLQPNPRLVVRPVDYPPSETYVFAPLKERVQVFQQPFKLVQRVALSTAPRHRAALAKMDTMTIRGTLDYQACDDRVCFLPESVPLSYTVRLRPPRS
jgi:hypothetical protein